MKISAIFLQLLKFGISGILGVSISTILYYAFRVQLPYYGWGFWIVNVTNLYDVAFYLLTTCIGGTVHFLLSKVWVFDVYESA